MPDRVIFDLDGTLSDNTHRLHFIEQEPKEWDKFFLACGADLPIRPVIKLTRIMRRAGYIVVVWSGRSDIAKDATVKWMREHGVAYDALKMRVQGDYTPDHVMKEQWLHQVDTPPAYVFDDRDSVVAMWRRNGVTCLQVAPGAF